MMEMMTAEPDESKSEEKAAAAMMEMMCDHADAVMCVATTEACQDPPEEGAEPKEDEDPSAIVCVCKCSALTAVMSGEDGMKAMCKDMSGTIGCIESTSECSSMKAAIFKD